MGATTNTMYHFADPKFIGKRYLLEDTTIQRLIEEADREAQEREAQEREDRQRCPDCGNVRDECGTDPADMWLVCGHCEEEKEAAEEERQIAACEDAEPDFDPGDD